MRVDGMRDGLWKRTLKIFYGWVEGVTLKFGIGLC